MPFVPYNMFGIYVFFQLLTLGIHTLSEVLVIQLTPSQFFLVSIR